MVNCEICSKAVAIYKCPACFTEYCSVTCCKTHKDLCAGTRTVTKVEQHVKEDQTEQTHRTVDAVPQKLLSDLRSSEELKDLLRNKHLRNMLIALDNTKDPEKEIQRAMLEPIFTEFADACLRIVEPNPLDENGYS